MKPSGQAISLTLVTLTIAISAWGLHTYRPLPPAVAAKPATKPRPTPQPNWNDWKDYRAEDGSFACQMPAERQTSSHTMADSAQPHEVRVVSSIPGRRIRLLWNSLNQGKTRLATLEAWTKIESNGFKVRSNQPVDLPGLPGDELLRTGDLHWSPGDGDIDSVIGLNHSIVRIYAARDRAFVLEVGAEKEAWARADADRLFKTFVAFPARAK